MPKIIVKKRHIKVIPIIVLLLIGIFSFFLVRFALSIKIKNIYITGNNYLNDEYVIDKALLTNYPSILRTMSWSVKKRLEDDLFIKSANVNKSILGTIEIAIEENKVLFYKEYDNLYVLSSYEETDYLPFAYSPIRVINYIPDTVFSVFEKKFSEIKDDVRDKISEIKYDPSEYDDNRFLLYMVDGNYVYITTLKMDVLNYYNEIYPTLDNKKGTLYLDSGNHFVEF